MRSRLKRTRHVGKNGRGRLTKSADACKVKGRRRRGRPKLRWEECRKRFGGSGRGLENKSEGWGGGEGEWRRVVETGGGDGWWRGGRQ